MHIHDNALDAIILVTMIVSMYSTSFILHETKKKKKKNERFLIQNISVTPTTSVHGAVLVIVLSLSFYE